MQGVRARMVDKDFAPKVYLFCLKRLLNTFCGKLCEAFHSQNCSGIHLV